MNNELLDKIKSNLDTLIERENLRARKTVIFGMNHPGDFIIRRLRDMGVPVAAVIDNNPANRGIIFEGVSVILPEEALSVFEENAAVLICSRYYSEMKRQLETMGYAENTHIFRLLDVSGSGNASLSPDIFREKKEAALKGAALTESILALLSASRVHIAPSKSNGDTYIVCAFWRAYTRKYGFISDALVVAGKACAEIAEMFGIKNIYIANQEEIDILTAAYRMSPRNGRIRILQPYWNYASFINNMDCYKSLNFFDFYKYWVMGLDKGDVMEKPSATANESDLSALSALFEQNGLKKGKTVIISPYANSLNGVPHEFFESAVSALAENGYTCATNTAGNEAAIRGALPLKIPLSQLIPAAEYAGAYLGIRNGLTELLSASSCRMAVVYPQKNYAFGTALELYATSGMYGGRENTKKTLEATYTAQNADKLIKQITNHLTGGGAN